MEKVKTTKKIISEFDSLDKTSEITLADGSIAKIRDFKNIKALKSLNYNYLFNRTNGMFVRWGHGDKTVKAGDKIPKQYLELFYTWKKMWGKDAGTAKQFFMDLESDGSAYAAPEIVDIEVSLECTGTPKGIEQKESVCNFCYKSNFCGGNQKIKNMSFNEYKIIIDKMPKSILQCALGIGDINSNPDLWKICDYTKSIGIVPNITFNGYFPKMNNDEIKNTYDKMSNTFGAIAVSHYSDDLCLNAIHELATVRGMKQCNIHFMISKQTFEQCKHLINLVSVDDRAKNLNALVLLSLKKKGNAVKNHFESLSQEEFNELCDLANEKGITIGMDSCSGQKTKNYYKGKENEKEVLSCIEPCESSLYSVYINTTNLLDKSLDHSDVKNRGNFFCCSFCEGEVSDKFPELDWTKGISILSDNCKDFMKDVWCHPKTKAFRERCIECREKGIACAMFTI